MLRADRKTARPFGQRRGLRLTLLGFSHFEASVSEGTEPIRLTDEQRLD
jgi:hypothetical protein